MNLESTVAFQERTIQDLSQALLRQQARLDQLETKLADLLARPESPVGNVEDEPPPPHY